MPTLRVPADDNIDVSPLPSPALTHKPQWNPALRLALPQNPEEEEVVVSRRGRGSLARLESPPPINRYAGDWSVCGRDLLSGQEADYDEVAGSESDRGTWFLQPHLATVETRLHSRTVFKYGGSVTGSVVQTDGGLRTSDDPSPTEPLQYSPVWFILRN